MKYDLNKFEDVNINGKGWKSISSNNCKKCIKKFEIGETIYRIVKQDYCSGYRTNPKKQINKMKLCEKCYKEIFTSEVNRV